MAVIGATSSLPRAPAKVCLPNLKPALRLAGGSWSFCPLRDLRSSRLEPPDRAESRPYHCHHGPCHSAGTTSTSVDAVPVGNACTGLSPPMHGKPPLSINFTTNLDAWIVEKPYTFNTAVIRISWEILIFYGWHATCCVQPAESIFP